MDAQGGVASSRLELKGKPGYLTGSLVCSLVPLVCQSIGGPVGWFVRRCKMAERCFFHGAASPRLALAGRPPTRLHDTHAHTRATCLVHPALCRADAEYAERVQKRRLWSSRSGLAEDVRVQVRAAVQLAGPRLLACVSACIHEQWRQQCALLFSLQGLPCHACMYDKYHNPWNTWPHLIWLPAARCCAGHEGGEQAAG